MFKSLVIKNFQSHEETRLDFTIGTNVIIGLGQSGKTAIIRSILWLLNNRPLGFRFHSNFAEKQPTEITLELLEGIIISISRKGTGGSNYKIIYPDGTLNEFSGVGTDVPDEVSRILNMGEVNISKQISLPFLITDSPSEVGKTISRMIQMEKVEAWTSHLGSRIRSNNSQIKLLNADVSEIEDRLKEYDTLPKKRALFETLEKSDTEYKRIFTQFKELCDWKVEWTVNDADIHACSTQLIIEPLVDQLSNDLKQFSILESDLNNIKLVTLRLQELDDEMIQLNKTLAHSESIEVLWGLLNDYRNIQKSILLRDQIVDTNMQIQRVEEREVSLSREWTMLSSARDFINECGMELSRVERELNKLEFIKTDILKVEGDLIQVNMDFVDLKTKYGTALLELKKCPLCSNDITTDHVASILEEIK